ncbi:MAG: sigma-70 family RNA polymerase sigma factor [Planctomycetota bacterium]|nr:sigma-70 family RNA polymerase sigma factor [Planctomycetota bacterium]
MEPNLSNDTHEVDGSDTSRDQIAHAYSTLCESLIERLRSTFGRTAAEDAVNEFFLRLMRIGPGDGKRLTFSYLYVCCRRLAARTACQSRTHQLLAQESPAHCEHGEETESLTALLQGVTRVEWDVIRLTVVDGLTYEQAAASLGISISTLMGIRQRSISRIRDRMGRSL